MADSKPNPLTEDQRTEVRDLLQRLSAQSTARASRRGTSRPSLKRTKKLKRQPNPFESIDQGQSVQGVQLPPVCITLPLIQRTRLILMPFHLDQISIPRAEWIKLMREQCGLDLSTADAGTEMHLRFVVEANPPVKYVHVFLEKDPQDANKMALQNWLYAT